MSTLTININDEATRPQILGCLIGFVIEISNDEGFVDGGTLIGVTPNSITLRNDGEYLVWSYDEFTTVNV
jgi:hypothetical protein